MPKYADGKEVVYEVIEEPVKYFETFITGNTTDEFTVTNHILPIGNSDEPEPHVEEEVPPYTGIESDNNVYLLMSVILLLSICGLATYCKEN